MYIHSPHKNATKPSQTFASDAHLKLITNQALFSALAHIAKLVVSFSILTAGYRDLNDPFRAQIVSRVPPLMLFIASPVPFARSYTLAKSKLPCPS